MVNMVVVLFLLVSAWFADPGGADDELTPSRADITQFWAVPLTDQSLSIGMGIDDTGLIGGQSNRVGVNIQSGGETYRLYSVFAGSPAYVTEVSLYLCEDETCFKQEFVTNEFEFSWDTLEDPWSSRANPDCYGTNCGTLDAVVWISIPFGFFEEPVKFYSYSSYPTGVAQAGKDLSDPSAIVCQDGECVLVTPTAVKVTEFTAKSIFPTKTFLFAFLLLSLLVYMKYKTR